MLDAEIIKALECCQSGCCGFCPLLEADSCYNFLAQQTLALIQRQQEEIKALIAGHETLQKHFTEKMARIVERLEENKMLCGEVATEAIEMNDLQLQVGARNQVDAFAEAIEIVKGGAE